MKSTKRFIAVVIALALVMSFGATVFADTTNDGSITVRNATVGKDYTIYKVFDLTYAEGTDTTNVSYTFTKTADNTALFEALASKPADETAETAAVVTPFILTETTTAGVFNVALNPDYGWTGTSDDAKGKDIGEFLAGLADAGKLTKYAAEGYDNPITATGNTVKFENLPYGYYYVKSSLDTVATVDSTLKNVTVVDKNEGPTWDNETPDPDDPDGPAIKNGKVIVLDDGSKVIENSANYGDVVNFSIAVNATAYKGTDLITYYYIYDTLGAGFTNPTEPVVIITLDDADPNADPAKPATVKTLTKGTDYTISKSSDGLSFKIDIPFGEKYGSNAKIEVTYSATVDTDAVIADSGNINAADFAWATDPTFDPDDPGYNPSKPGETPEEGDDPFPTDPIPNGDTPYDPENPVYPGVDGDDEDDEPDVPGGKDPETKETTTYVYALGVTKTDGKTKADLAGAKFSFTDADGNPVYAIKKANGVYDFTSNASATGATNVFEVASDGMLVVEGLEEGTYTLKEVEAPKGYNPLTSTSTMTVSIKNNDDYTNGYTHYYDKTTGEELTNVETFDADTMIKVDTTYTTNVAESVVENNAGVELPSTGGFGTTLLIGLGSVLFIATALLLVTKKRMYNAG